MAHRSRLTTMVGVPIDCTGRPNGLERMPATLREEGFARRLTIRDQGDLQIVIEPPVRDPATGIIGFESVCRTSEIIRDRIADLMARGERPLVVGGCCTLLIGVFAALRRQIGRVALAFVDGHLDFYDGRTSPTGEAADMDLAVLSGLGPPPLTNLGGASPMVLPQDVAVLGYRDAEEARRHGMPDPAHLAPGMTLVDAQRMKRLDRSALGKQVADRFGSEPGRFWLHLDFDVLDEKLLPAVDYRMSDGLDWDELAELVRPLASSPALVGADITIYNPTLDPDRRYARQIVDWLTSIL